jgi:5'-phosphate synthase pdxT subunit
MARVGVLALQGGVAPHARALEALGHRPVPVRSPRDLDGLDGLVLPGGESTAQLRLIDRAGLAAPLGRAIERGVPVLATCAGLILAAARVEGPPQPSFGWIDVAVARNAWGRQVDSFEAIADRPGAGAPQGDPLPLVFIRAPRIVAVGPGVVVLATFQGEPVLVREDHLTAATFHPELTADLRIHRAVFGEADLPGEERIVSGEAERPEEARAGARGQPPPSGRSEAAAAW